VLDIGSAYTRVLAGDLNEGALRYRGHGVVESAGMRKGLVSEPFAGGQGSEAAKRAGGVCGAGQHRQLRGGRGRTHIRGINTNGGFELGNRCARIYPATMCARLWSGRGRWSGRRTGRFCTCCQAVHSGRTAGIFDPVGWWVRRLEVDLHIANLLGVRRCKARLPAPTGRVLK